VGRCQATRRPQFANSGSNMRRKGTTGEKTEQIHYLNWCWAKQAAINSRRSESTLRVYGCWGRRGNVFALSSRTAPLRIYTVNPLNAELNPFCHLPALLGAHHILHVSRIRVNRTIMILFHFAVMPCAKKRVDRCRQEILPSVSEAD